MRSFRYLVLLLVIIVAFYWKILLTHQFSLLTQAEGVNQGYAWLNYWVRSIWSGDLPLWDPYIFGGRSFPGEMQTAAFYPLNLLFALAPFNAKGVLPPAFYHIFFALSHSVAAFLMFTFVRELQLSPFAALISAISFSLGGIVGRFPWPHMLGSSIWLPLILLLVVRAMKQQSLPTSLVYAAGSGMVIGISILAGGLHVVIMQAVTAVAAVAYFGSMDPVGRGGKRWFRAAFVSTAIAVGAFAAGAVQLLPSIEYSANAIRFLGTGALPAVEKIPYVHLRDGIAPHGLLMFVLFQPFNGSVATGEAIHPYMGVLPFLLAVIGVWKGWSNLWVRFPAALFVASCLFSLGGFSLLHGLVYATAPVLWMAREPGRWLYLADFAVAVSAAFGAEFLFKRVAASADWETMVRSLAGVVAVLGIAICVPALFGKPEISPWNSLSILIIFATWGIVRHAVRHQPGPAVRGAAVCLILFDLAAFDWSAANTTNADATNYLEQLLNARGAVDFLKSRTGLFRVQVLGDSPPNIGDAFGIQTIWGAGVTLPSNSSQLLGIGLPAADLLNVRYFLKPASSRDAGAVYSDAHWKVYENPWAFPRAWIVHETAIERSASRLLSRLAEPDAQLDRVAWLRESIPLKLEPAVSGAGESAIVQKYSPNSLEVRVRAQSRGLLVLSEMFYPGWHASVNGQDTPIWEVDAALRGIVVPQGLSTVDVRYRPASLAWGAGLTVATFAMAIGYGVFRLVNRPA